MSRTYGAYGGRYVPETLIPALDELERGWREMMARTGRRTVPQIYIGDTHVGGYDELAALDQAGRLDALLRA